MGFMEKFVMKYKETPEETKLIDILLDVIDYPDKIF